MVLPCLEPFDLIGLSCLSWVPVLPRLVPAQVDRRWGCFAGLVRWRRVLFFVCFCRMIRLCVLHLLGDTMMADKKFELTNLEVQWVRKSLQLQRASLQRSISKEIVGSDIYVLRQREIADLYALMNKF